MSRTAAIALTALLALGSTIGTATAAPPDPFKGTWKSIDTDGSSQKLSFGGTGDTRNVRLVDTFASGCGGGTANAHGKGTSYGDVLEVTLSVRCASGAFIPDTDVIFWYDAGSDTLEDSFGVTWFRP